MKKKLTPLQYEVTQKEGTEPSPKPTGQRYCMNSAALRFIPKEDLDKEGYGQYRKLFP